MSKYIKLIKYVDFCSTAFVNFINLLHCYDIEDESFIVNLSDNETKQILDYCLDEEFKKNVSPFGMKTIFIHTCTLKNNWKCYNMTVDDIIFNSKYNICDDSIMINMKLLTSILERKWKKLCKLNNNNNIIFISLDNMDAMDIVLTINNNIGKDYITEYNTDFNLIEDINLNYFGIVPETPPEILEDKIKNILINNKLLI